MVDASTIYKALPISPLGDYPHIATVICDYDAAILRVQMNSAVEMPLASGYLVQCGEM